VSAYVLARALPPARLRVDAAIAALRDESRRALALAELADAIAPLGADAFVMATAHVDVRAHSPFVSNYVAAMIEEGAALRGVAPPSWTREVAPLSEPWFAAPLKALKPYLLRVSPVPFKRRNLFIDASTASRV
jgi:hypothetical protein